MKDYFKPSKPSKDQFIHLFIAFAIEIAAFGVCMALFRICKTGSLLQESVDVAGEMTNPTVGRLVYCICSFWVAIGLVVLGSRLDKKGKTEISFGCAFGAGVFFWQSLGEGVWHFAINGTNFIRLECQQSMPIAILFIILLFLYGFSKNKNFAIWTCLLSFATNYLGHFLTLGLYPFISSVADWKTFCITISCVAGVIAIILGTYLTLFCKKDKKTIYLASMLIFIGAAVIYFGITES